MAPGAALIGRHIRGDLAATAPRAIMLHGLGPAGPALGAMFAFSIASFFVGGLAHGAKNVAVRSLLHERVPEHCTAGRTPPTTACATRPSSSRCWWAACSSPRTARGRRSWSPARSPPVETEPEPVYPADSSACQRWNAFPSLSEQRANQPCPGTGARSSAWPPSSRTLPIEPSMSSVAK